MRHDYPQFKARLEPEVKAWLKQKAEAAERSQTWLINHLIKEAMRHDRQPAAQK
ncbi:hypothetical protein [Halomonas sp.]|uniref:hypothetical protein n=1 Tax=Halomonas sp. TaxID=1486246 RepID=UPI003D131AA0